MTKRLPIALAACLIAVSGCNLIYKQNIQQGNAMEQEDLDQLRLGMSQNQVAFLLGTPSIRDPFHHDRWDYVSSFSRRGGEPVMRKVTLLFEDGALVKMLGVEGEYSDDAPVTEERDADIAGEAVAESGGEPVTAAAQTAETPPQPEAAEPDAGVVSAAVPVAQDGGPPARDSKEAAGMAEDLPIEPESQVTSAASETAGESAGSPPETTPAPALGTTASTGGTAVAWTIQAGAFELQENAETLLARLVEAGYEFEIVRQSLQDIGDRYLVRLGGLASRADAEAALEEIDSMLGITGFIVPSSWPKPE